MPQRLHDEVTYPEEVDITVQVGEDGDGTARPVTGTM